MRGARAIWPHTASAGCSVTTGGHLRSCTTRAVPNSRGTRRSSSAQTEVVAGLADGGNFVLELADGTRARTRRVLLATGMDYRPPQIRGLAELWGGSAFHCPFCHGWEMRDQPLAVLARGDRAVHMALLLRGWTDDVVVLTNGPAELDAAHREQLGAANVRVDERVDRRIHLA